MPDQLTLKEAILAKIREDPSISNKDLEKFLLKKGFIISSEILAIERIKIEEEYGAEKLFDEEFTKAKSKMKSLQEEVKHSFPATYLGGHLKYPREVEGYLKLTENHVHFIPKRLAEGLLFVTFEVPLKDIENLELMTKKEITAGRVFLLGVLALAYPEEKKYLKLTYKNKIGLTESPVFYIEDIEKAVRVLYDALEEKKT